MPEVPAKAEDVYQGSTEVVEEASPNSTCVAHYRYNRISEELTITFRKDGAVHTYTGVNKARFEAFKGSSSLGRFFNAQIRIG